MALCGAITRDSILGLVLGRYPKHQSQLFTITQKCPVYCSNTLRRAPRLPVKMRDGFKVCCKTARSQPERWFQICSRTQMEPPPSRVVTTRNDRFQIGSKSVRNRFQIGSKSVPRNPQWNPPPLPCSQKIVSTSVPIQFDIGANPVPPPPIRSPETLMNPTPSPVKCQVGPLGRGQNWLP